MDVLNQLWTKMETHLVTRLLLFSVILAVACNNEPAVSQSENRKGESQFNIEYQISLTEAAFGIYMDSINNYESEIPKFILGDPPKYFEEKFYLLGPHASMNLLYYELLENSDSTKVDEIRQKLLIEHQTSTGLGKELFLGNAEAILDGVY